VPPPFGYDRIENGAVAMSYCARMAPDEQDYSAAADSNGAV